MRRLVLQCIFLGLAVAARSFAASEEVGPGVLKAQFIYQDPNKPNPECPSNVGAKALPALAVDLLVSLAGHVTESLIDAAAARTQPEATTLETVIPIDGFYSKKEVAVDGGCLIFHNGTKPDLSDASIKAKFRIVTSSDQTAFRFDVL